MMASMEQVARAGIQDTLAVYQFGDLRTTVLEIVNCEHGVHWATWKMLSLLLQRHEVETLHETAKLDTRLTAVATHIVSSFNLSSLGEQPEDTECAFCAYFGHEWLDTVSRFGIKEQTWLKDPLRMWVVVLLLQHFAEDFLRAGLSLSCLRCRRDDRGSQPLDRCIEAVCRQPGPGYIVILDLADQLLGSRSEPRPGPPRTLAADERAVAKFPELLLYPGPGSGMFGVCLIVGVAALRVEKVSLC
eukprot:s2749_g17.t2